MENKEKSWAKKLGLTLRHQRKMLGLTQKKLSDFAGCGVAFVYLVENGKPSIRLDKLIDILQVLGLQLKLEKGKNLVVTTEGIQ